MELTRKSLHLLIALVPLLLSISRSWTIAILIVGTCAYIFFEYLRMHGKRVPVVSTLTEKAERKRDKGKFVKGPITLGLGALCSVLFFSPQSATIAIYILAFGDGLSSLAGKAMGHVKLPFTGGKSLAGSITCFVLSFLSASLVSGRTGAALVIALCSTAVEALPTKDWDNLILPFAAGLAATLLGI
ncbi:MAG: SEC59/DGK1/VTE5 family protein [Spirochaetaceae bacterium]|nr:SEC59/DGK1/VTE5 family protein [Spirochaetaceae bacterium]